MVDNVCNLIFKNEWTEKKHGYTLAVILVWIYKHLYYFSAVSQMFYCSNIKYNAEWSNPGVILQWTHVDIVFDFVRN